MGIELAAMMAMTSLAQGYQQSEAIKAQATFQRDQANENAKMAERQAEDAMVRGNKEANRAEMTGRKMNASARVAAASSGLNMDVGNPAEVRAGTQMIGALEALTIKNNATREAYGYRSEAANSRVTGRMFEVSGRAESQSTLLAGGMKAAGYGLNAYDRYKEKKG